MVNVIFTIGADGVVKNLRMRGPDRLLEDEAKRMIDLLPQMIPGKQKGKKVDVPYSIPISFRLESEINQTAGWKLDSSIKKEKSLDDDKNPLFLVDGKEYTKQQFMEFEGVNADNIKFINVIFKWTFFCCFKIKEFLFFIETKNLCHLPLPFCNLSN